MNEIVQKSFALKMYKKTKKLLQVLKEKTDLYLFFKYFILFLMLFLTLALALLLNIISSEANPFFYENF